MDRKCQNIYAQEQYGLPPCSLIVYPNQAVGVVPRVITFRQPGWTISLQIVHSMRLKLNFSSSPSTVSSFPASPHKRHTAVCGSTGCWERGGIRELESKLEGKDFCVSYRMKEAQNPQARCLICQDDLW